MISVSKNQTLNELCEFIIDTKHKTPKFTSAGYPCIRTPNIGRGFFKLENAKYVDKDSYIEWISRAIPTENDLILAREAPVGNVAIIPKGLKVCHGQRTVLIRPNNELVDPHYLMYLMLDRDIQNLMHSIASGATVPHLNMSDIRSLKVPDLPVVDIQKKIADVLKAYDNLIENNNRRIAILEDMAQSLYREWFVHFRFPGYEKCQFKDSELGMIPEGWEVKKAKEIFNINIGKTPPRKQSQWFSSQGNGLKWLSIKDMGKSQNFVLDSKECLVQDAIEKFNVRVIPADTVIMSFKLTVGKVAITTEDICTNEAIAHFNIINDDEICKEYIYLYLRNFDFQILGNTSSIGNAINSQIVKSMRVVLPKRKLVKEFKKQLLPIFEQLLVLVKTNKNLKKTTRYAFTKAHFGKN